MPDFSLGKILSWVSPEEEDDQETPLPTSYTRSPTSSISPAPSLSRSNTTDPTLNSSAGRARALSRPTLARSSTLRTIDEGESPYGSYISRSNSFPPSNGSPQLLPMPRTSSGGVPKLKLRRSGSLGKDVLDDYLEERRGSRDSFGSILEGSDEETGVRRSNGEITPVRPANANGRLAPGEASPSPSPGWIERRRQAANQAKLTSGSDESSRDSSPSKTRSPKVRRGSVDDPDIRDQINAELGLRRDVKGKGRATVMELEAEDGDGAGRVGRILNGGTGREVRRMEVAAYNSDEGDVEDVEPIVIRSPSQGKSGARRRKTVGISGETTLIGSSGAISSRSRRSSSPSTKSRRAHEPDLSLEPNETSSLLGPIDQKVPFSSQEETADEEVELVGEELEGDAGGVWYKGPLFEAGWKLAVMFVVFTGVIVGVGWFALPTMAPEDKGSLKLPRSFQDLQALNTLFQKYKHLYPFRILTVACAAYLYVQMFSLPGSMYISILLGAAYGIFYGLVLSCLCEATGALLCYSLSAVVGPPLLTIPSYRARLETWRIKIMGDPAKGEQVTWDGVFAFLIVLRIAPFPPHWVANVVAPHLSISPILFWFACFIGIGPVSVIHVTIGSGLDNMTSAEDFHILSLRNILGLIGIGVAVMIPTALKRVFKKDLSGFGEPEAALNQSNVHIHPISPSRPDSPSSTLSVHTNGYYDEQGFYQSRDGSRSPLPPSVWGSGKKGRTSGEYMDLNEALSIIQQEEDHEILAVAYPGDTADSVLSVYEREAQAAATAEADLNSLPFHGECAGSETDDAEGGHLFSPLARIRSRASTLGGQSVRRKGYGTIERDDIDDDDQDGENASGLGGLSMSVGGKVKGWWNGFMRREE